MDNLAADFEINPNNPLNAEYELGEGVGFDCSFELFASGTVWGSIDGDINNQTDLINLLNTKVDLTSFEELSQTVTNNYNELSGDIADLTTTVTDNYNTLSGQISDLTSTVNNNYTSLDNRLTTAEGSILDLTDTVNDNYTELNGKITTTNNNLSTLSQTVENNNTAINNRVDGIVESFDGDISDLNNAIDNLSDTVSDNYTELNGKITVNTDNITTIQNTINSYGDIVSYNAAYFATANQGALADTALQPNDNISELVNDVEYITSASLPTVNNATITIQKNGADVGTFTLNQANNDTLNITVPTDTQDLTNGAGYITNSALNGYATENFVLNQGYITGITSTDVTTALGYVPYNSTNPSGYTTNVGTVTSVNNTQPDANGNVTLVIPDTATWGNINGTLSDQTDLQTALDSKYDASNPNGYITSSDLPTVDQTFDGTSANAQSGVAISGAGFLQNTATGTNSITILGTPTFASSAINIGVGSSTTIGSSVVIGNNAQNTAGNSVAIGEAAKTMAYSSIAIGSAAVAQQSWAYQIGRGANNTANSLKIGFGSSNNYQLLDGTTGLIPDERISSNIARTSQIPTVPTNISAFTNDSGYITSSALNGYATETWVGNQGYITGITSSDVTTALGYTPYNSTNPSGYITSSDLPIVNNGTLTIQKNGTTVGTFTANQSTNSTINIEADTVLTDDTTVNKNSDDELQTIGVIDDNSKNAYNFTVVGSPTITDDGIASGFSISNYLTTSNIDFSKPFEVKNSFILNQDATSTTYDNYLFTTLSSRYFAVAITNGLKFNIRIGNGSSSWVSTHRIDSYTCVVGVKYYVKLTYDLSSFKFFVSIDNNSFTEILDVPYTFTYPSSENIGIGQLAVTHTAAFQGSIDLKQFSITVDGAEVYKAWQPPALKYWSGTKAQYDAIVTKDANTLYNITDDSNPTLSMLELLYPVGSIYIGTMSACPLQTLGVGTWQLVAQDRVLQGAGTRGSVGDTLNESLPNITGRASLSGVIKSSSTSPSTENFNTVGAMYATGQDLNDTITRTTDNSWFGSAYVGINASRSSSTYQDNAPVQQDAYLVNIWERVS